MEMQTPDWARKGSVSFPQAPTLTQGGGMTPKDCTLWYLMQSLQFLGGSFYHLGQGWARGPTYHALVLPPPCPILRCWGHVSNPDYLHTHAPASPRTENHGRRWAFPHLYDPVATQAKPGNKSKTGTREEPRWGPGHQRAGRDQLRALLREQGEQNHAGANAPSP